MAEPVNDFESLMERVRAGCPNAAREVFDGYSDKVRGVVRRALHHRLRSQFDSFDFVQSVWASFFDVPAREYNFDTPEALVAFLSRSAFNKVIDKGRELGAQKRDVAREQSLDARGGDDRALGERLPVRAPSPSQVAIASELRENLLEGQPPEFQKALEMLRQGHGKGEVAAVLGLHPKHLQRILKELRRKVGPP